MQIVNDKIVNIKEQWQKNLSIKNLSL